VASGTLRSAGRSSAAVVLAADAIAGTGPGASLFAEPAALDRPAERTVPDATPGGGGGRG
jgi:hypothetical protein